MKKVISALLLVCMLMSLCAVGAYAEGDVTLALKINDTAKTITLDLNENAGAKTFSMVGNISITKPSAETYDKETWSWTVTSGSAVTTTTDGSIEASTVGTATVMGKVVYTKGETTVAELSDTANVEVINSTLQSVSIDSSSITTVPNDGTNKLALSGIVTSVDGKTVNDNVSADEWEWTSSNAAVTVTGSGSTAFVKSSTPDATANITLKVTDKYGQTMTSEALAVTVASAAPAPAPVVAALDSVSITDNKNGTFTAEPKFNTTVDETVLSAVTYKWDLATVDKVTVNGSTSKTVEFVNGDTAEKAISFKVTATYNGVAKEATSTYTLPAKSTAKTMTLSVNSSKLFAGGNTYTLSALDGGVAITEKTVTYEILSDETKGAKVSGSTLTTGAYGGKVVVTASCDGYTLASGLTIEVADGITLKATPDTLTIGSSTNTSQLTAYYNGNGKTEAISGVTWNQVSTSGANVATLDASTGVVTAGSAAGTVKYRAVIGGKEITTAEVTVTVRANNIIEFDVAGFYNSVSSFTVTAKGGVLQLVASNARLKSSPSTQIPGTFNFNWVPATGDPSNGIEVTNLGSGKATAYGRYNGSYSLAVTFTPNDTATYPVTTQNHTVIVNYTPSIIKGNYGVWDGTNGLDFLVNDHISNWSGQVWVDGNLLSDANYVCRGSSDGQIWVTLTPAFISWLRQYYNGNGIHTITVGVDGRNAATGYFKTWGTASSFNGVKTGDDANLGLWAALLGVSAVGAAAAVVIYKRKKANG